MFLGHNGHSCPINHRVLPPTHPDLDALVCVPAGENFYASVKNLFSFYTNLQTSLITPFFNGGSLLFFF